MTHREFAMIANLISKSINVKCVQNEHDGDIVWKANPVKKIIYYPKDTYYTNADLGYLIHEVGHLRFSQPITMIESGEHKKFLEWVEKFGKSAEQIFHLVNALEDVRIEEKMKNIYPGAAKYLQVCHEQSLILDHSNNYDMRTFNPTGFKSFCEAKWLHYCKYWAWKGSGNLKEARDYLKRWYVDKEVYDAIEKTDKSLLKKIIKCKNTQELCMLIKDDLLKIYIPLCDNEDVKKKKKSMKEFEKFMKEMMEKFMEMMKDIEAKIKKARKDGKGGKVKCIGKIEADGKLAEKVKMEKDAEATPGAGNPDLDSDEIFKMKALKDDRGLTKEEILETIRINLPGTKKAISILKDINIERFEGNYDSGKLQNRKLYKLKTGQTKVFTRKIANVKDNKDMVFGLLIDQSGSMHQEFRSKSRAGLTSRVQEAALSAGILAKALQSCNKPFAIYGFNNNFRIYKEFNKKLDLNEIEKIVSNSFGSDASYNNDGYAISRVIEYLKKRPEKHKILMVISDGQPAPGHGKCEKGIAYRDYDLKDEVIKAEKIAKVYGIGIEIKDVKEYYKRHIILDDTSLLGKKLVGIFRENIGKRIR